MEGLFTFANRITFHFVEPKGYVLVIILICLSDLANSFCRNNQTANLGEQASITCKFPDDFHAVLWYDDAAAASPVITYVRQLNQRRGPGFDDGSYDIFEDGSLHIPSVTIYHERTFSGILYTDPNSHQNFRVSLVVIASPVDELPIIPCHNCHQEYYYIARQGNILSCYFNVTRPPVQLEWLIKIGDGYEHLETQQFTSTANSNGTFNSLATVHLAKGSSTAINFLVCRATWPLSDWRREREILVDFSSNKSFSDVTPKIQHMEINRYAKIQCGQSTSDYVVWKRILSNSKPEVIGFHSHVMTKTVSDIPDVEVRADGSLIFASPSVQHEGIYVCNSGAGQKDKIEMTSLGILIPPSPPYIQITGCDGVSHRCVIRQDSTKKLTCAVYGARPSVTLEWIAAVGDDISYFNDKLVFKERGETSDTILSVEYKVSQNILCGEEIVMKCHFYGPLSNIMKAESTALVIPESCVENEVKEEYGQNGVIVWVVLNVLLLLFISVSSIVCRTCGHKTKATTSVSFHAVATEDSQGHMTKATTSVSSHAVATEDFQERVAGLGLRQPYNNLETANGNTWHRFRHSSSPL